MNRFVALDTALDLIRNLRRPLAALRCKDRKLYEQIRAAASSAALNVSEGNRRSGADRRYHFRIAAGSADEACTGLRVAEAWGYLGEHEIRKTLQVGDRLLGLLFDQR